MAANQPPGGPPEPIDRLRHLSATPRDDAYAPSYTILVRRLRILLPVAGILVLGIVALWPRIRAELNHPSEVSQEDRHARMLNTRYVGADSHGRPYTITADSTEQAPGGGPIDMVGPVAELTLENGRWVAIKADRGHYDQAGGWIDLNGHVEIFHDEGYRFTTEHAHVEVAKNLVWGDRAVEGHGPKGDIVARGFRVIDKGDTIVFTGPSRLLLRPKAAQIPDPTAKHGQDKDADQATTDSAPLVVTASQDIEWLQQDRAYVARGNAVAKRGTVTLTGETLTAFYRNIGQPAVAEAPPPAGPNARKSEQPGFDSGKTEIWRIVADGNVHIDSEGRAAEGAHLDYDADKKVVVLTGHALKATTPTETITARDSLEYWQDDSLGVARGDAQVTKKDQSLAGDAITAHFAKDDQGHSSLKTIDADGHIVITTATDIVHGDQGTYDMETQRALVTGNVVATRGESELDGDRADVDQNNGISRIFPVPGKRVRGYFVPHKDDKPAKSGDSSGPLEVTADGDLELLQQDHAYVARGNAVAKRGDATLTGNILIGYYRPKSKPGGGPAAPAANPSGQTGLDSGNTEIWRVVATGNVHLNSGARDAYGERMDYDADKHLVVLTGQSLKATTPLQTVTARDSLEYWQDLDIGVARGNALVTQKNGKTLAGDAVGAHFAKDANGNSSLDTMRASNHVIVTTVSDIVHGDQGTYDAATQRAVVTGNVKVTRGECQLEGESAEVNQDTGISQVFQGPGGKRVSGLFVSRKCQTNAKSEQAAMGMHP